MKIKKTYISFRLAKGNGKFRCICAPLGDYKVLLKSMVSKIANIMLLLDKEEISHGFMHQRSCITNALKHVGSDYVLTMDLSNFFDSVSIDKVCDVLDEDQIDACFVDGIAKQGLPTSPAIANLAFRKADLAILKAFDERDMQCVYTRYADDLTISFNNVKYVEYLPDIIRKIVIMHGFVVNESKTKLQKSANGRFVITGVGVDKTGVYPTRKVLKKIRAAIYQGNNSSVKGLEEWAKCKAPRILDTKIMG
ncbi:MAG: reverse transcriptase family protein [Pseudomonadota bacterium]